MNKKYFTDSLSDEVLAKIIDDTLNFKKSTKNRSIKIHLLKIIPAVAAVVLMIGLINILPVINIGISEHGSVASEGIDITLINDSLILNNNVETSQPQDEYTAPIKFGGVLGIGYKNADGEIMTRISSDGGVTWYISDDYDNRTLDPDIPAIEWGVTYDEFKEWIDERRTELSDEDIESYESELEDVKNGIAEAGKVIIENHSIIFVFYSYKTSGDTATYTISNGETWQICSQEQIDNIISMYEIIANDSSLSNLPTITIDGVDIYSIIQDSAVIKSKTGIDCYAYSYIQPEDGEKMGFGGDTFAHLKRLVRNYFNERVEAGKMTREEADSILTGITKDNTRVTLDREGNIIE